MIAQGQRAAFARPVSLCSSAPVYAARRPTQTSLHQTVQQHLEDFLEQMDGANVRLPSHIGRAFRDYLGCGDLRRGFIRGACTACHKALLIAFSRLLRSGTNGHVSGR